jgi:hypothetical protein
MGSFAAVGGGRCAVCCGKRAHGASPCGGGSVQFGLRPLAERGVPDCAAATGRDKHLVTNFLRDRFELQDVAAKRDLTNELQVRLA